MDPVAHTLVGATLSESGLKRLGPLATTTLVIAANLPDVDGIAYVFGGDMSLCVRRGWTHGVLAWVVLPVLLAWAMTGIDALRRRRRPSSPPARVGTLLLVAAIGVWSHPALDWLNSYGVRLLMPFDGRWFYGDTLFIVDPWLWLLMGAAAVLSTARGTRAITGWLVIGTLTTALVVGAPQAVPAGRIAWGIGVAGIALLRIAGDGNSRASARVARACLGLALAYILLMFAGGRLARTEARAWLEQRGFDATEIAAMPVAANPFVRDVVARDDTTYRFLRFDALAPESLIENSPPMAVGEVTPAVEAALGAPWIRGLRTWLRFPSYTVRPRGDGYRVVIRDVRFWRVDGAVRAGLGFAAVDLDRELRPIPPALAGR